MPIEKDDKEASESEKELLGEDLKEGLVKVALENNPPRKKSSRFTAYALSAILGALTMGILWMTQPCITGAHTFKYDNQHTITRVYRPFAKDIILINSLEDGKSMPLNQYLNTISGSYSKTWEEEHIKRIVGW